MLPVNELVSLTNQFSHDWFPHDGNIYLQLNKVAYFTGNKALFIAANSFFLLARAGDRSFGNLSIVQVKGYIRKAIEEGGKILCGETVDEPLDLGEKYKKVECFF